MNTAAGAPPWYPEFEELLDGLLSRFRPEWQPPAPPPNIAAKRDLVPKWRCNQKRSALGAAMRNDLPMVRANKDAVLHLAMHDLNPSLNRFLISPIIAAIGHQEVHEAIIRYVEKGTFIEQLGAMKAWYTAQPGLRYSTAESFDRGDPTGDSALRYSAWMELWPRYQEACRKAIEGCRDPKQRAILSQEASSFAEVRQIGEP